MKTESCPRSCAALTHGAALALVGSHHECRAARVVHGVDVGPHAQDQEQPGDVLGDGRGVERSPAQRARHTIVSHQSSFKIFSRFKTFRIRYFEQRVAGMTKMARHFYNTTDNTYRYRTTKHEKK